MSRDSSPAMSRSDHRRAMGGDAMKRVWLVQYQGREEHIEADDVEITASGVLVFYRLASRMEQDRTLLTAFSPGLGWRCQLESVG